MRINHNIPALKTLNQMSKVNSKTSKSMEKLSSGLRINSAADDAAGMAISNKMDSQIKGLKQANRNTMDGISLIQTAEGAYNEVDAILKRMRELAVQSANGTYSDDDRKAIQDEIDQLDQEIRSIQKNTEFNQKPLLGEPAPDKPIRPEIEDPTKPGGGGKTTITVDGVEVPGNVITGDVTGDLSITGDGEIGGNVEKNVTVGDDSSLTIGGAVDGAVTVGDDSSLTIGGDVGGTVTVGNGSSLTIGGDVTGNIEVGEGSSIEVVGDVTGIITAKKDSTITITGDALSALLPSDITLEEGSTIIVEGNVTGNITFPDGVNVIIRGDVTGSITVTGNVDVTGNVEGQITITDGNLNVGGSVTGTGDPIITVTDGSASIGNNVTGNVKIENGTLVVGGKVDGDADVTKPAKPPVVKPEPTPNEGDIILQIGANKDQSLVVQGKDMDLNGIISALKDVDMRTQEGSSQAIENIDEAIKLSAQNRSKLGAYQNRLEHTTNNLLVSSENLTSALSRIQDTDMAEEMATFTQQNVLSQAATAMLAQANQIPQQVLQLLQR